MLETPRGHFVPGKMNGSPKTKITTSNGEYLMDLNVTLVTANEAHGKEVFPTWRIIIWALGSVGTTIIGSLAGLMTYFFVPPQTSQSAYPQYLSNETILGITILGLVGYIGGILVVLITPLISTWSDRSRSRLGRRKVFMLASFLPISVLSFLMFLPPVDHISSANAIWLFTIVILLNIFRSLYGVSSALVPELSSSSSILMKFNTYSSIGWVFGYVIGSQAIFLIKDALMNTGMSAVEAFRLTVGSMIAVSTILVALQVWVVDERRYGTGKSSQANLWKALKMTFSNRTFVLYTLTNQVYYWGDGLFQSGLIYFVTIIFHYSDTMMVAFGGTILGLSFLIYPFVSRVAKRTGKKNLYMLALLAMTVITMALGFADRLPLPISITSWVLVALIAIPGAITGIIPGAINNEIVREDCLRTGEPKEASFGAAAGLITVIPSGFVNLILPSILLLGRSVEHPAGVRWVAITSSVCNIAALFLLYFLYDEKKILRSLKAFGYV
jgi:glycoside/pentoside/hexuronide:cation symporter, GPH family